MRRLHAIFERHWRRLFRLFGTEVIYAASDGTQLMLDAVRGIDRAALSQPDGSLIVTQDDDFLFLAADLTITPDRHDKIIWDDDDGVRHVFSVMLDGNSHFDYLEQSRAVVRVRTTEESTEAAPEPLPPPVGNCDLFTADTTLITADTTLCTADTDPTQL